jgi:HlyD family secretion protein
MRRIALVALAIVVVAAAALVLRRNGAAVEVDVQSPRRRDAFQSFVTASGEIVAQRYADIGSSVMGRVVSLPVAEGETVREGQLLARIDPVPAESDAKAAEALLRALTGELQAARARAFDARQARERTRELHAQGLVPASQNDAANAAADAAEAQVTASQDRVSQAEAQLRRARDQLSKTEIRAPMPGVVTRLAVREGEMVVIGIQNQPGTILMTLSDLSTINAEVKVAEADVLRLKQGQKATVTLEAVPGRELAGEVVEIGASALPVNGTGAAAREFRVVVRLAEPDPSLRPGLTCDARILVAEAKDVTTVPLQAVVLRPGAEGAEREGVFVLDAGRARFQPVTTGILGGLDVVVQGLDAQARVIVGPFQSLRELKDGATVKARASPGA